MTSIAASPPWLLAYGGNDDGLQTGPLKEVQLDGRYAPSSGFILHDGLSCQVNVDRYSNRHFSHTSTAIHYGVASSDQHAHYSDLFSAPMGRYTIWHHPAGVPKWYDT